MSDWTRQDIIGALEDVQKHTGMMRLSFLWCIGDRIDKGEIRAEHAELVLPVLNEALLSEETKVRSLACGVLGLFGESACPALERLRALAGDDLEIMVRNAAQEAVSAICNPHQSRKKPPIPISVVHCFLGDAGEEFAESLSALARRSPITLEDYDSSTFDFDGLPEYPADCMEGLTLRPFVRLGRQEYDDADGCHRFLLSRFKASLVAVFAGVSELETEAFCRRWSEHWIYTPFQGREHVSPEVALAACQEAGFRRLHRFFTFFRPLCQEAIAMGKSIYFLEETHEMELA